MKFYNPKVLIGKNVNPLTVSPTVSTLQNGELMILKEDMTELGAGETVADSPFIYILQGTELAGRPIWSPKIIGAEVEKYLGHSYSAPTQQVTYIGNDGVGTGSIEVSSNTEYELTLILDNNTNFYQERPNFRRYHYTSDATATQQEIADAFTELINNDPYTSQYVVAASVTSGGDQGIEITGIAPDYVQRLPMDYQVLRFTVTTDGGFASTPVVTGTNPDPGKGSYAYASEDERLALGNRGVTNFSCFPAPGMLVTLYATPGATYDNYVIMSGNTHDSFSLSMPTDTRFHRTSIYLPSGASTMRTHFEDRLNPWMESAGVGPAGFTAVTL